MEFYLSAGVQIEVNSLTKVTMTPMGPTDIIPPGAMVIPPNPLKTIMEAAKAESDSAAKLTENMIPLPGPLPPYPNPWSVTFTEKR